MLSDRHRGVDPLKSLDGEKQKPQQHRLMRIGNRPVDVKREKRQDEAGGKRRCSLFSKNRWSARDTLEQESYIKLIMDTLTNSLSFNLHVLIETNQTGKTIASVAELADMQVQADTRGAALAALQTLVQDRLSNVEILPLPVSLKQPEENPWVEFTGLFEDDDEFSELAEDLRKEWELDTKGYANCSDRSCPRGYCGHPK